MDYLNFHKIFRFFISNIKMFHAISLVYSELGNVLRYQFGMTEVHLHAYILFIYLNLYSALLT